MTRPMRGGRRRLDRVLAEDYLSGIESMALAELRALRDEAQQEETDLSYLRRLLHGRIDIVRAELERRGAGVRGSVVEELPKILAGEASEPTSPRHLTAMPSRFGERRRRIEQLVTDVEISDVSSRTDDELRGALERLVGEEKALSETRQAVQQVTDACSAEVARRYRDGEASVDDLLRDAT